MIRDKALMLWSGGKDSAMALLQAQSEFSIDTLVTTVSVDYRRISMHGVHEDVLAQQVESLGLNLDKIYLKQFCSNQDYQTALESVLVEHRRRGVRKVVFGDIFLADLRCWRERSLVGLGMEAVFPLWGRDTHRLAQDFVGLGFEAIVCCASDDWLSDRYVGVSYDDHFVQSLPPEVDPCGENGEFHSFVVDGPTFRNRVAVTLGEKIYRALEIPRPGSGCGQTGGNRTSRTRGFWYCDLVMT